MIIQLKGLVKFPITLDASVWIFDDRKVILEEAFLQKEEVISEDQSKKTAELFDQAVYFKTKIKPPVNKTINKFEKEKALTHSFVMPILDFVENAEIDASAKNARLITSDGHIIITVDQLKSSLFLFAVNGKPVEENGPIHLYFGDGSNKDTPIQGVKEIIFE